MSSDWIDRIWLDPRLRIAPGAVDGGPDDGAMEGGGADLRIGGFEGGLTLGGGGVWLLSETAGIEPDVDEARRSSSESAGSPTTWSAAISTPRARATSIGYRA